MGALATYALLLVTSAGQDYALDTGLTAEDCVHYLSAEAPLPVLPEGLTWAEVEGLVCEVE